MIWWISPAIIWAYVLGQWIAILVAEHRGRKLLPLRYAPPVVSLSPPTVLGYGEMIEAGWWTGEQHDAGRRGEGDDPADPAP